MWDKGNAFTKQTESFSLNVFISIFLSKRQNFSMSNISKFEALADDMYSVFFIKVKTMREKDKILFTTVIQSQDCLVNGLNVSPLSNRC